MEEGGVLLQCRTECPVGDLLAVGNDQTLQTLEVGKGWGGGGGREARETEFQPTARIWGTRA